MFSSDRFVVAVFSAALIAAFMPAPISAAINDPTVYSQMRWRMIGPFRGGRTVAVAGVADQPSLFYMAPVNGGVWKSDDYGRVWAPIFDGQKSGSIGAIAIAPSNPQVIYVGSGEGLRRPDLATGDGIYKSLDGGSSWTHLGLRDGQQINALAVDPRDPNRVYAAVLGHPYGPNNQRGLYRSLDGGTTWKAVLSKDDSDTGAVTVTLDPNHPDTLYAALWASRNAPWHLREVYELPKNDGLFKSTDSGTTWTHLSGGLPTDVGRIGVSVSPADSDRIYAWVNTGEGCGIYRSNDAGANWIKTNGEERVCGRGEDFSGITADPKNPDIVYAANTSTYRSTDGAKTWTAIKGAPGGDDYHAIWINPNNPKIILLGCDQGATLSVNGGATWSSWYNQPTAEFYHVITDNRFPYWVYGAQQESGSAGIASRGNDGAITSADWHPVAAEEYGYIAPDPLRPNIIFGGKLSRFDFVTGQAQDVMPAEVGGEYRFNRTAPLIFSRRDPRTLYFGANVLFKTRDSGHRWQIISPDLTRRHPGMPASMGNFAATDPAKGNERGVIYSLAPSYLRKNTIWAGTDDGLVWITRDGGAHWHNITPPGMTAWSKVAQIDPSHFDDNTDYVAVNRFRLDDLRPYIYRTHDGGATWHKITDDLPSDASVNTVREDPVRKGLLFAGTERTVYTSFDDGNHWQSLQLNLPSTSVRDLVVHDQDLVIATHGRSFWILDDLTPLRQFKAATRMQIQLLEPQTAYRIRRDTYSDTPLPPEEPVGQNPPDGAIFDYSLAPNTRGPVSLAIYDRRERLVRRFSSDDRIEPIDPKTIDVPAYWTREPVALANTPGPHRFVWDLHGPTPPSLFADFPISAIVHDTPQKPLGVIVTPGRYTVRLIAGGKTFSQPLVIKMDPRVQISKAALRAQFDLANRIADRMNRTFEALQKHKSRRLARLNSALGVLYSAVEGADAAPTRHQREEFTMLDKSLQN